MLIEFEISSFRVSSFSSFGKKRVFRVSSYSSFGNFEFFEFEFSAFQQKNRVFEFRVELEKLDFRVSSLVVKFQDFIETKK